MSTGSGQEVGQTFQGPPKAKSRSATPAAHKSLLGLLPATTTFFLLRRFPGRLLCRFLFCRFLIGWFFLCRFLGALFCSFFLGSFFGRLLLRGSFFLRRWL